MGIDIVSQDVFGRFRRNVMCSVFIPSHYIFPLAAFADILEYVIDGKWLFLTSIYFVLPWLVVEFSRISD